MDTIATENSVIFLCYELHFPAVADKFLSMINKRYLVEFIEAKDMDPIYQHETIKIIKLRKIKS